MAFNPSSTIYLCNVPIDSTYKNEIYFVTKAAQQSYFASKVVKTFSDYLTVRTTRADGSLKSSIKVNANIDTLRGLPCNYMYYQNANHGTRYFYAFITQFIYINEGTTEIVFETDVYQTWLFDVTIKPSYVVREHSVTDKIGGNVVPEKFNFNDYVYKKVNAEDPLAAWGYLVATTDHNFTEQSWLDKLFDSDKYIVNGLEMSGIYQGLFFWYFERTTIMNEFLNDMLERSGECIVFIAVVPKFCVSNCSKGFEVNGATVAPNFLSGSDHPATKTITIENLYTNASFEGYKPKNKKLLTSPYYTLYVTNNSGGSAEYEIEDWGGVEGGVSFQMFGDVSASPSVTLIPTLYKGLDLNYECGISITDFPQVSFNTDTFKLWLAQNQYSLATDTVGNIAQIVAGIASIAASVYTGGASGAIGAGQLVSGVSGVMGTANEVYKASKEPNKSHGGGAKTNLLTAMNSNKFMYYIQTIKKDHARMIDDFFTMYGYQTNKVKAPNVNSRPYFNFVQTADVNLVGAIPSDDMRLLKDVYNNGVTLWKPDATVGDYSVDNAPVES